MALADGWAATTVVDDEALRARYPKQQTCSRCGADFYHGQEVVADGRHEGEGIVWMCVRHYVRTHDPAVRVTDFSKSSDL